MPTQPTVEELAAAGTQPSKHVLEVGCAGRGGPERRRIERAAAEGEQSKDEQSASDLEAAIGDVLVRYPITGQMQRRTESERGEPRAGERTERTACRHVKRDDHDRAHIVRWLAREVTNAQVGCRQPR